MLRHYWFTAWPDNRVPSSCTQLLRLIVEVECDRERLANVFRTTKSLLYSNSNSNSNASRCFDRSPSGSFALPPPAATQLQPAAASLGINTAAATSPCDISPSSTAQQLASPDCCTTSSTSPTPTPSQQHQLSPLWTAASEAANRRPVDQHSNGTSTGTGRRLGPVVVHCSAGVGRTGCFIAVANGVAQYRTHGRVDVLGLVARMRLERGGMVQTCEQYEFIYRALADFASIVESGRYYSLLPDRERRLRERLQLNREPSHRSSECEQQTPQQPAAYTSATDLTAAGTSGPSTASALADSNSP